MATTYPKAKGRSGSSRFAGIPHAVMKHENYLKLSPNAKCLLFELALQYNGHNNGNLSAAWKLMKPRGFRSESTLNKALHCLLKHEFIVRTREGRFCNPGKRCALYALTWCCIDSCPGKDLEINPTTRPYRTFKDNTMQI